MRSIAGVEVHEEGQEGGLGDQVIVMIHGWPDTYRLWDAQVEALKPQYRCIRFTLPGFEPNSQCKAYSLTETIAVIREIVESISPDQPVVLMVHDWGCLFGYQFAMSHPNLVCKIIGLDIGDAGSRYHMKSLGIKAKLLTFGYQCWLAAAWRIGGGIGDRMTRFMARQMRYPGDVSMIGSHMNYPYYIKWTGAYGSYNAARTYKPSIPMLFIYGAKKPFMFHSPEWMQKIDICEGSQVIAMDAGHWMMCDAADSFNATILEWLAQSSSIPSQKEKSARSYSVD